MAAFDRVDGRFVARPGIEIRSSKERDMFKNGGWQFDRAAKLWYTTDHKKAEKWREIAVGDAKEYFDNREAAMKQALEESWAEDTDEEFPIAEGYSYMPFQKAGVAYAVKRERTLISDPPGLGKSQPVDEPVLTPIGWRRIGDLSVGDLVIGSDGHPTKVTGVFPQGALPTYKVSFRDGSYTRCSESHLWAVRDTNRRKRGQPYTVKPLEELLSRGIYTSGDKNKWDIPLASPIEYPSRDFFIAPYTLGVLIGDGSLKETSPSFSCPDGSEEISDRVSSELRLDFRLRKYSHEACCTRYVIARNYSNKHSEYLAELGRLNLRVGSYDKRIPAEYFLGSVEQRMALLQGLMDTDGSSSKNRVVFHSTNLRLAADVQQLVWSLGGSAILRTYDRTAEEKPVEYQVNVKMMQCPFHLKRKAAQWWPSDKNGPRRFISEVIREGEDEHVCISVSAADKLYVTRDYTVTHNTIQAIGVSNTTKPGKVLVVCPASLKVNWSREWRRFDSNGMTVGIAMSLPKTKQVDGVKSSWTEYDFPDTDVVVINYDMLETFDAQVKSRIWDLVVFDEAHLLKSRDAVRTKIVFGGKKPARKKNGKVIEKTKTFKPIEARRHLYLTGTPIMSKPVELWTLIQACDPKGLGRSFTEYAYQYCAAYESDFGLDTSGASNLEELGTRLRTSFMVRRDKESVLKELPPKRREVILFPADKLEKPIKKEKTRVETALSAFEAALGIEDTSGDFRFISAIEGLCGRLADAMAAQDSEEPNWNAAVKQLSAPDQILFTELAEAREEVALAKTKLVAAHVKDLHNCGEPVILFAYHKSVVEALKEKLTKDGMRVGTVTGSVPPMKRQAVVDDFQNGDIDVIIGNITAMGVGFTLTRARFVVFAELDWVPAMIEQAEDRAWRNGQLNAVMVQHLLVDGSIESRMAVVILEKMEVIFEALDAIRVDK